MENFEDNKKWELYSTILSEEGINFEYSSKASTAYFDLKERKIIVPIWNWLDEDAKQLLVSHEVGHAKFSNYTLDAYKELSEKFLDLFNIVEDARIERLMKKEYLGLNNIFKLGYKILLKNKLFNIPDDFSECNLVERLNLYAKVGTIINIPFFNKEEYDFAYKIMNLNTKTDVISLCYDIYEYLKEKSFDWYNSDLFYSSDDNIKNSSSDTLRNKELESEIRDELIDKITNEFKNNLIKADEENKKEDELQDRLKANNRLIKCVAFDTNSYDEYFYNFSVKIVPYLGKMPCVNGRYYIKMENMVKNLAKSANNIFHQKMSANENVMQKHRTIGKLDTKKLAKYSISENIFRNIKELPQGKNHAIVMLLDYSSSMKPLQLLSEFIQACIFGEFCKMNNIPFSIYAYGMQIYTRGEYYEHLKGKPLSEIYNKEKFLSEGIVLIGSNYIFDTKSILWLATNGGKRKNIVYNDGDKNDVTFRQGGTPTIEALKYAYKKLKSYKNSGIEKLFLYIMTDGMYNRSTDCKYVITKDDKIITNTFCSCVSGVKDVIIDNKLFNINDYTKYFNYSHTNYYDWTFELLLSFIKKETNTTIVYSFTADFNYIMIHLTLNALDIHPKIKKKYNCNYMIDGLTCSEELYFYKHFLMFEKGNVDYDDIEPVFTYNFKNNPFIDQYIYLNSRAIQNLGISKKLSSVDYKDVPLEDYLKNTNKVIKIFEILVKSFISFFS